MHSRDPALAARFAKIEEDDRIRRFTETKAHQNRGMGRPVRAKFSGVKAAGLLVVGGCAAIALLAWGAVLDQAHGAERETTCYRVRVIDGETLVCAYRRVKVLGLQRERADVLRDLTSEGTVRCAIYGKDRYGAGVGSCSTAVGGDFSDRVGRGGYVSPYRRRD